MVFADEGGGYVARCPLHAAWVWRNATLTNADLAQMKASLKRHITKNTSIVVEYRNCWPEEL